MGGYGRRPRQRIGGKRWSAEQVLLGAGSSAAMGGRGKIDGRKTRPRQRAGSQPGFSSTVDDGDGAGGGDTGDRGNGDLGGERRAPGAGRGGRAEGCHTGTADHKFRMQAGQSNTLVAVRLRPLLKHDREQVEVAKVILSFLPLLLKLTHPCSNYCCKLDANHGSTPVETLERLLDGMLIERKCV